MRGRTGAAGVYRRFDGSIHERRRGQILHYWIRVPRNPNSTICNVINARPFGDRRGTQPWRPDNAAATPRTAVVYINPRWIDAASLSRRSSSKLGKLAPGRAGLSPEPVCPPGRLGSGDGFPNLAKCARNRAAAARNGTGKRSSGQPSGQPRSQAAEQRKWSP